MKKQIVVIGLGRFGSSVAQTLYNQGHDVLAIDHRQAQVQMMMGKATHALAGDATNDLVLRELGLHEFDVAIVAIGSDLVASVMVTVMLKDMGVGHIVARAKDQLHANTLERLGVNKVVQVESENGCSIGAFALPPRRTGIHGDSAQFRHQQDESASTVRPSSPSTSCRDLTIHAMPARLCWLSREAGISP